MPDDKEQLLVDSKNRLASAMSGESGYKIIENCLVRQGLAIISAYVPRTGMKPDENPSVARGSRRAVSTWPT